MIPLNLGEFGPYETVQDPMGPYMGHQDQDGEKVGQMSLFFLKVRGCYGQRKAKIHTLSSPTILS